MSLDYATYKHLCKQLDEKFENYVILIEGECNRALDPLLKAYETTISELYTAFETRESTLSQEEKRVELERIDSQGKAACFLLFEAATPFVTKKEEKLKHLNSRMRFARETVRQLYLED